MYNFTTLEFPKHNHDYYLLWFACLPVDEVTEKLQLVFQESKYTGILWSIASTTRYYYLPLKPFMA